MTPKLPDVYETRQAKALLEALKAGDLEQARKIENHLLAEASTSPDDREALAEELRAMMLFRAHVDASAAGDEVTSALFQTLLTKTCSERVVRLTVASALFYVGLEQGWLSADHHDYVTGWLSGAKVSAELKARAASIKRLP